MFGVHITVAEQTMRHQTTEKAVTFSEDTVIERVCEWLASQGFTIAGRDLPGPDGPDIIAHHPARGAWRIRTGESGASDEQTAARAVRSFFTAAAMAEGQDAAGVKIGLALPRSAAAQQQMAKVRKAMSLLRIVMLWMEPTGEIVIEEEYRGAQEALRPEELNASNDD